MNDVSQSETVKTPSVSRHIFISYASQDAAVVNALVSAMEAEDLRCWIAPRDVPAGALYADEIIHAINGALVLVLILSSKAIHSPHVGKVIERATAKRKPIVTMRIDEAPLTPAFEYFLSESQWIQSGADGVGSTYQKVVTAVRRQMMASKVDPLTFGAEQARGGYRSHSSSRFKWILAVAAALLLALGSVVVREFLAQRGANTRVQSAETHNIAPGDGATTAFSPPPHSIAVLPFANMSGDPKQDYFSDGVSEEVLNTLARLKSLQVVARTSSFAFKGKNVEIDAIARALNVGTVLEGSVRRAGNTVRITVQLIDSSNGFQLWSQTYDRKWSDILKIQTDVATSVAERLERKLTADDIEKIEIGGTNNKEAYEAYLEATLQYRLADDEPGFRRTLAAYDQAIAQDPNYASAYVGRAFTLAYLDFYVTDAQGFKQNRESAIAAASRAMTLAPELGQAHLALGWVLANFSYDFVAAANAYKDALALAPGVALVQNGAARFYDNIGKLDAALVAAHRAVSLDPRNSDAFITLEGVLYHMRKYADVKIALENAKALYPSSHFIGGHWSRYMLASAEFAAAARYCEDSNSPLDEDVRLWCLAISYRALGKPQNAEVMLERFAKLDGDLATYSTAQIYAQWGNKQQALQSLNKAVLRHNLIAAGFSNDPLLDPIRNEPEFNALVAQMHYPP